MDFDDAIRAHANWKMKLASYIRRPDHSLKSSEVALDDGCDLGRWIHGEGNQYASLREFSTLKSEHQRFHTVAAAVISNADAGIDQSREVSLGANSDYGKASSAVVKALMAMKAKAGG